MRVIILAAGNSIPMNGVVKCLIKNPYTNKTLLEHILDAFAGCTPTVAVGYKAIDIMQEYPRLDYVYNADWSISTSSYSLALALNDEPCYVISGDMLIEESLPRFMDACPGDMVLTRQNENRLTDAVSCVTQGGIVTEMYVGPLRRYEDPEAVGVYKFSSEELLRTLKDNCMKHKNLYIGQNIPFSIPNIQVSAVDMGANSITEFNTYQDYINFINIFKETRK